MDVCMDSRFHHSYMDWGYYGIFIISDELNGRQERGERLLLSFLCSKTHIFCLKLYAIFLRKYTYDGFDMGLCHVKALIFRE